MQLRLSRALKSKQRQLIRDITAGLPSIDGGPVFLSAQPELSAYRGKLLSSAGGRGTPVYAASFIRERRIVLESSLFEDEEALRLILVHELFHFAWPRLGNQKRRAYAELLKQERRVGARGELGESADLAKQRNSKDYPCESFCDTAARLYAGVPRHPWYTLAPRWCNRRAAWFGQQFGR